jgi:hypothetical protein
VKRTSPQTQTHKVNKVLTIPKLIGHISATETTGAYYFKNGVRCFGNPHTGPWVEQYPNGATRKFETGETPIGSYSAIAQRQPHNLELFKQSTNCLQSRIQIICTDARISFPPPVSDGTNQPK